MGEEIYEEGIKCSQCLREADIYCERCRRWHCIVCLFRELKQLAERYPEYFT